MAMKKVVVKNPKVAREVVRVLKKLGVKTKTQKLARAKNRKKNSRRRNSRRRVGGRK